MAFAELGAGVEALSRTGRRSDVPRESLVAEAAADLRRMLSHLPADRQEAALAKMAHAVSEVPLVEWSMDSLDFSIPWLATERPKCPCDIASECELLFRETGVGPEEDRDTALRARPEDLARCPLHPPVELTLVGAGPRKGFLRWWSRRKDRPARGWLTATDEKGQRARLEVVEGDTVAQMMRKAKRALWDKRQAGGQLTDAQVVLVESGRRTGSAKGA